MLEIEASDDFSFISNIYVLLSTPSCAVTLIVTVVTSPVFVTVVVAEPILDSPPFRDTVARLSVAIASTLNSVLSDLISYLFCPSRYFASIPFTSTF